MIIIVKHILFWTPVKNYVFAREEKVELRVHVWGFISPWVKFIWYSFTS